MDKPEPRGGSGSFAVVATLLLLGGCAAAPLYRAGGTSGAVTGGEIPRDSRGEPVWHLIRAAPPGSPVPPGLPAAPPETAEGSTGGFPPPR